MMPYHTRNTIILLIIMVIVLSVILFLNISKSGELEEINQKNNEMQTQLDNLKKSSPFLGNKEAVINKLEKLENKVLQNNKVIPNKNTPILTYEYLLQICNNYCPNLKFDFDILEPVNKEDVQCNVYSLKGKANIYSLYEFIYQIETQPLLVTIVSLNLNPISSKQEISNLVNFNFKIHAYYKKNGTKLNKIPFYQDNYRYLASNPFKPRIHAPRKPQKEEEIPNIDKSKLIGLTKKKIFLQTQYGRVVSLSPGDNVLYGKLKSIDYKNKEAIFSINKIGIKQEIKLQSEREKL